MLTTVLQWHGDPYRLIMQKFTLNAKIYPLEAILNCCYSFVDKAYIFLDSDPKTKNIKVTLKQKSGSNNKNTRILRGEFMNELLYSLIRQTVSKNNKKIREYIVGRALYSTFSSASPLNDPLGIAIPWEKKYSNKQ